MQRGASKLCRRLRQGTALRRTANAGHSRGMTTQESPVDRVALGRARAMLKPPVARDPAIAAVAAAAFFAVTALSLAVVVVMVPPVLSATAKPHH